MTASRRRVLHVVGARPNFMKAAPIVAAMAARPERFEQTLVHTGQHYDENMSRVFLRDLGLPEPDVSLGVGSGTHAETTARVMLALEPVLAGRRPDTVLVVGDVDSTVAAALVAAKLRIPVAHVEAGLRSGDRTMPEELNRIVTDQLSDLCFTTEESGERNLRREGVEAAKIHFVGNVMIDSLVRSLARAEGSDALERLGLEAGAYAVATLHRPANVDDPARLGAILAALGEVARQLPVVFPVHPRTRARITAAGGGPAEGAERLRLVEPLGYLDFLRLTSQARLVLTDSGGIQEETTYLRIPCLTIRPTTERPVTVEMGSNRLVDSTREAIEAAALEALRGASRCGQVPPLWDGRAAERIVDVLAREP